MNKYTPSPSVAKILESPISTKEQAYELGYDAGRLAGFVESQQLIDSLFAERKSTEKSQ